MHYYIVIVIYNIFHNIIFKALITYSVLPLQIEDSMLRDQIERYNQKLRDFEEKQRVYRGQQDRGPDQDLEVRFNH